MDNYYYFPLNGPHPVTSPYGPRTLNGVPDFHPGVDFGWNNDEGTHFPVYAAADGTVEFVKYEDPGAGNWTRIVHNGNEHSGYMHLSQVLVAAGQEVVAGQQIAVSGESGGVAPHLHFEIRVADLSTVDPLPLLQWLGASTAPIPPAPTPPFAATHRKGKSMIQVLLYNTLNCFFVDSGGALVQKYFSEPTQAWVSVALSPNALPGADVDVQNGYQGNIHVFTRHKDGISMVHCTNVSTTGQWVEQVH